MTYSLACADFTFPLLKHDDVLRLVAMLDLEGIDIGLFEGRSHLWPSREFTDIKQNARHLKHKLGDLGLVAADVFLQMDEDFVPFAINHPEADRRNKARDWFSQTLEYANELGCHHITVLPGVMFNNTETREESLCRAYAELEWRVKESRKYSITLGTEAHVGSLAQTPAEAMTLVQAVPGLTLTLDYTHFTRAGLPDSEVHQLIPLASHFHVRGARKDRLQARFDDNTIDYAAVLREMDQANYTGWLGIEYVWINWEHCNECDNISETVLYRDYLRSVI